MTGGMFSLIIIIIRIIRIILIIVYCAVKKISVCNLGPCMPSRTSGTGHAVQNVTEKNNKKEFYMSQTRSNHIKNNILQLYVTTKKAKQTGNEQCGGITPNTQLMHECACKIRYLIEDVGIYKSWHYTLQPGELPTKLNGIYVEYEQYSTDGTV